MAIISWNDFEKVDLRVGRILSAQPFPEAHQPAYILKIDLGEELGVRKSSARITDHYDCESLEGRLVLCVCNFAPKQIGPIMSECLVCGFYDAEGKVRLCGPDGPVPPGTRLA